MVPFTSMVASPPSPAPPSLRFHTSLLPLSPDVELGHLSSSCHGYSGADLAALAREAAMNAFHREVTAAGAGEQHTQATTAAKSCCSLIFLLVGSPMDARRGI
jgi:hypothetical protein